MTPPPPTESGGCSGERGARAHARRAVGGRPRVPGAWPVARADGVRSPLPAAQLIVECNTLTVEVDDEIVAVHAFIRDRYRAKFPELESLVLHPIDYARVVRAIKNEMDTTEVDLDGVLPSATIMVVSVTGSTTNGQPLSEEVLARTLEACDRALALDEAKQRMLRFVESRMAFIAPNLSAVVGTQVAAQLMGTAGGLAILSRMPACNVQVLGAKRKALGGMSSASAARAGELHAGFVYACDLVQQTPPAMRMRVCRLVGAKCTLMARLDAYGEDPAGAAGLRMRAEMRAKIEKWQEPPPAKIIKPLPVPDLEPKKRRGGRRLRKQKERYGQTDMRKAANRLNFNQPEEETGLEGVGLGVLGAGGGDGRLRLNATQSKKLQRVRARCRSARRCPLTHPAQLFAGRVKVHGQKVWVFGSNVGAQQLARLHAHPGHRAGESQPADANVGCRRDGQRLRLAAWLQPRFSRAARTVG